MRRRRGEQPADVVRRFIENYFSESLIGTDALGTFADRPEENQELTDKFRQEAQQAKSPQEQAAELRAMFDEWAKEDAEWLARATPEEIAAEEAQWEEIMQNLRRDRTVLSHFVRVDDWRNIKP